MQNAPTGAASTGAIPKSISFDKAVYDESGGKHGKASSSRDRAGFFRSFKLPKIVKQSRGGGNVNSGSGMRRNNDFQDASFDSSDHQLRRAASDETSDDILAKYRKKSASQTDSVPDSAASDLVDGGQQQPQQDLPDERLVIDPQNIEASYAFQDAKRKLRLVLGEADLSSMANFPPKSSSTKKSGENDIVWLLRVLLAEAHNLQDRNMVAQLHETLRCVSLFDADGCRKLLKSLKEDYKRRSPYLTYLVRCRQGLLNAHSRQERLLARMEIDQRVCSQHLVSVCMRLFLDRREKDIVHFVNRFKETTVSDEKIALMEQFLARIWSQLEEDPSWALVASEEQMRLARLTIERAVVSHIYMHAMYPNGEADASRDAVLAEHMARLAKTVTLSHPDLRIPRHFHYEAPWPSAQAEIRRLAAYKTASDKVACVVRCSQTIMNLLSLAKSNSVPAADDFVPVMVFVLIKANPPNLLSTVQYVESFYGSRLTGEEQYWWMQFQGAVEFIKTID